MKSSGKPIVSIADFADYLGLSAWTVSRAINGHPEVNIKTRERVLAAMAEIGFRPNPLARGLVCRKSGFIGVSVAGLGSPILHTKIYHLQEILRRNHLRSLLEFSVRDPQNEARVIEDFFRIRVDGIILIYSGLQASESRRLLKEIPCVHVDPHYPQTSPSVALDRYKAMQALFEHLLKLGHRQFALLGIGPDDAWRWPALAELARMHKLDPEKVFISMGPAPLAPIAMESGRSMASAVLRLPNRPTAFITTDDRVATGAIQTIKDAGLRVPEDISVTGFDHLDLARQLHPTLTTIEQNPLTLMELAGQLLLDQLAAPERKAKSVARTVAPELIVGESTGPANLGKRSKSR